jgi:hypothetical protein
MGVLLLGRPLAAALVDADAEVLLGGRRGRGARGGGCRGRGPHGQGRTTNKVYGCWCGGAAGPALGAHEVVDAAVGDEAAHDAVVVVAAVEMKGLALAERHPCDGFHSGNKRVVLWSLQVEGWRRHGSGGGGQARTASRCAPARRTTAPSTYESRRALGAAVRTASPGSALWAAGADRPPRARPPPSAQ